MYVCVCVCVEREGTSEFEEEEEEEDIWVMREGVIIDGVMREDVNE